ncbi:MAG TPA: prolipoprotein diacylglyceryl transferase [Anaerolineaceae bacterium]|nr:MAG: prolipoprotein diacylglyceryl transferase [Chloroflexi bacterium GWB2_54_36]HAL15496.1 prolipoprotein diacylglyceryl transferase [Anaerolineaceae bacterium]
MPSSFKIGPLTIQLYGILIMLGALAAAWLSTKEAKRRGIKSDVVWDMFPWLIIGGIIGARLWHVLTPSASLVAQGITTGYYLTHPLDAIAIWKGGLGIPGAVIGGAVALWLYTRKRKMSFGAWTDVIAPGLALAQAIGRLGNYVNQELYGAPTDLPWALTIDEAHRLPEYIDQATYHPLFAYEAIYNLINMAVLLWIGRKFGDRLKTGDIFLTYLIIYPVGRFFLEFLRLDPSPVAGFNINQTIMAVIAVAATAALIFRHRKPEAAPKPGTPPSQG